MSATALLLFLAAGQVYDWPLDLPPQITSSFAEYRKGRFHAGVDLRTGGVGPAVHAVDDGFVTRVRCSPWGYGKAVYIRLADGNTVVFGHLDEFAPALRDYVRKAQHAAQDYTVDLTPSPEEFPVKRGEVIAMAGETGVGVAHLHYEIRDESSQPVNPRLLDISWPDTTNPVIRKLLAFPVEPGATVNGDIVPVVLDVTAKEGGGNACAPIRAAGRIAFAADVTDPANGGSNVLGVHTLRTLVGGEELFRIQNDLLSYDNLHNGAVSWHPFLLDEGRFLMQWRWPGNVTDCFAHSPGDGSFAVGDKPRIVRLEAKDFLGNAASVEIEVKPDGDEPAAPAGRGSATPGHVSVQCTGLWLVVTAVFPDSEPDAPILVCDGLQPARDSAFRRISDRVYRAVYSAGERGGHVTLRVEHARLPAFSSDYEVFARGDARHVSSGDVSIYASADSAYGALYLKVQELDQVSGAPLPTLGKAYVLAPGETPIDAPLDLSFPLPAEADSHVQLYQSAGSGWSCLAAKREAGRLKIATRTLGTFVAMRDDRVPTISDVQPAAGAWTISTRPVISAKVADVGSGIAEYRLTAGDKWLLAAYDPEKGVIEWEQDEDLVVGTHEIEFFVADGAGNTTTAKRRLEIREEDSASTQSPGS